MEFLRSKSVTLTIVVLFSLFVISLSVAIYEHYRGSRSDQLTEIRKQLRSLIQEVEQMRRNGGSIAYQIASGDTGEILNRIKKAEAVLTTLESQQGKLHDRFLHLESLLTPENPNVVHEYLNLKEQILARRDFEALIKERLATDKATSDQRLSDFAGRLSSAEAATNGINAWIRGIFVSVLMAVGGIVAGAIYVDRRWQNSIEDYKTHLNSDVETLVKAAVEESLRNKWSPGNAT